MKLYKYTTLAGEGGLEKNVNVIEQSKLGKFNMTPIALLLNINYWSLIFALKWHVFILLDT